MTVNADPQRTLRLSVIIPNFNYADFLGQAIDSALAIDWPHVQVIVVDDGSTDGSRELIAGYGDRITPLLQANAGQFEAYNAGYKLADGDVVIFLDSDDLLDREVMREVAAVWRAGISKVQFRLRTVDGAGQSIGNTIPQFQGTPTPEEIRYWATLTTTYPTPPGSGNAYAPDYLDKIFPLNDACGRPGDSICIAAAPFLGDVITIPSSLGCYRMHGRNDGAASKLDANQFHLHVVRARQRQTYTQQVAKLADIEIPGDAINNSLQYLPYRMASLRIAPATHPLPYDNSGLVLLDVLAALFKPQGVSFKGKVTIGLWTALVAILPRKLGMHLILWRFVPAERPQLLRTGLRKLGVIR